METEKTVVTKETTHEKTVTPAPAPKAPEPGVVAKATEASTKTLSVIGLIAVLALLSWGIVKVTPSIIRTIGNAAVTLSSIFVPAPKLAVTADNYTVSSGQPFTLSWTWPTGDTTDQGSYTISYPCINGVHLEATTGTVAGTPDVIFCNTEYHFLNTGNQVTLVPYIDATVSAQTVNVPVTLHFTKNGDTTESANVVTAIVVTNSGVTGPSQVTTVATTTPVSTTSAITTSQPVTTTAPVPVQTRVVTTYTLPNGIVPTGTTADLTATILATGVVSTTTNEFTPEASIRPYDRGAIQFEIENIGGKASGPWEFAVVLPTFPAFTFQSNTQPSLAPGDKIEYTIGFDSVKQQAENDFIVNVDNTNIVNEQYKANNIITGKFYVRLSN